MEVRKSLWRPLPRIAVREGQNMLNSIEILPIDGKFVVRIYEDGEKTETEFSYEDHARSWASGQNLRLVNTVDLASHDLAQAYSKPAAIHPHATHR
jgi:hypothetical protein